MIFLFTLTTFLSASLLFLVQPLFARMMLPNLGGSPAVWNTAMLFFQTALLAGYAYSHFISSRLKLRTQTIIHFAIVLLPLFVLPLRFPNHAEPPTNGDPTIWLLGMMAIYVGLPFFVVSTTGPLLQRWFSSLGVKGSADPYFLYAAGNVGSLLALIGYPFLVEPNLALTRQSLVWSVAYGAFALLIIVCSVFVRRSNANLEEERIEVAAGPTLKQQLRWILLAFVPSSMMLGTTSHLSADVASMPLMWVIPLSIYLLSFIIVFSRRSKIPQSVLVYVAGALVLLVLIQIPLMRKVDFRWIIILHLTMLFAVAMMCHGEMAKTRPHPQHLTKFFFLMSIGGALGGFFNAIVAPMVFPGIYEYVITLIVAAACVTATQLRASRFALPLDALIPIASVAVIVWLIKIEELHGMTSSVISRTNLFFVMALICLLFIRRPLRFGIGTAMVYFAGVFLRADHGAVIYQTRNFFGVLTIQNSADGYRSMYHGRITHGVQQVDGPLRGSPLSYYHNAGPLGDIFSAYDFGIDERICVVGLGVGTTISYGKPGQKWTVYEIDPDVLRLARKYFHYLGDTQASVKVVLGDARLMMQKTDERYSAIILDAYNSDSIPVHLMTREALRMYLSKLAPGGILVFHISNRHLNLIPVLSAASHELQLVWAMRNDRKGVGSPAEQGKFPSDWAVVARSESDLATVLDKRSWIVPEAQPGFRVWSDDYSSLISVMKGF